VRQHLPQTLTGKVILLAGIVFAVGMIGWAFYLASLTGSLPWQTDPTRIAITPFADIPGFSTPTPMATPAT